MEDYKFFFNFLMNDKLVIAVLCFGSHICNQAAKIRVKTLHFSHEAIILHKNPKTISDLLIPKKRILF